MNTRQRGEIQEKSEGGQSWREWVSWCHRVSARLQLAASFPANQNGKPCKFSGGKRIEFIVVLSALPLGKKTATCRWDPSGQV